MGGGAVKETQLYGTVIGIHEPVGTIGIICPDESPLLAFVSLVGAAIARSNSVVVVPSEKFPLLALDLYQVLETSDLPGGVVNIITGSTDHLTKYLAEHQAVDAMWYWGSKEGSAFVEHTGSEREAHLGELRNYSRLVRPFTGPGRGVPLSCNAGQK